MHSAVKAPGGPLVNPCLEISSARHAPAPRPGRDLRRADLRGRSLMGRDLEGADLRYADLRWCDLRGADLFDARLDGADLRGAALETTRIVEIRVPENLDLDIVNQIRLFDFRHGMTRFVGPNGASRPLPCPYRDAGLRPVLFEWGSRTWQRGRNWTPPAECWTLEEIVAAVLDAIGCRHDLQRACRITPPNRRATASR